MSDEERVEYEEWLDEEDAPECEGHESLRGDLMGISIICDGSCVS